MPQQLHSQAPAQEEKGEQSTLTEHQLMSQSSNCLSWRRMSSPLGGTGKWTGRADSCSTGSPPPPSPPPPPSQPPSVSPKSHARRPVPASADSLWAWSCCYLSQCLTDINFVTSKIYFHMEDWDHSEISIFQRLSAFFRFFSQKNFLFIWVNTSTIVHV